MPSKPSSIFKSHADQAQILHLAYEQFVLPLGNKKVPAPYRINVPFQSNRSKYGKSNPATLAADATRAAKDQNFDLSKATGEQIRQFMEKNQLGIDCSGFVYLLLDYLLQQKGLGGMEHIGFPPVSQTNVKTLTSDNFTVSVEDFSSARPGDLVRLNSSKKIPHVMIIINKEDGVITYAHSSSLTKIKGVHTDRIKNGKLPEDLRQYSYDPELGDGIRRLKALYE